MIGRVSAAISNGAPTATRVSHDDCRTRATPFAARPFSTIGSPSISDALAVASTLASERPNARCGLYATRHADIKASVTLRGRCRCRLSPSRDLPSDFVTHGECATARLLVDAEMLGHVRLVEACSGTVHHPRDRDDQDDG